MPPRKVSKNAGRTFKRGIRGNVKGLWSGKWDADAFIAGMRATIEFGLKAAWLTGMAQWGMGLEDMTPTEIATLNSKIIQNIVYVPNLARDIEAGSKAKGGRLAPLIKRTEVWGNRFDEVVGLASSMAARDNPQRWTLGVAEHCPSCLKLAGRVKRASYWISKGILPMVPGADYLMCKGYRCQCRLVTTTEPLSRGPLPRLP